MSFGFWIRTGRGRAGLTLKEFARSIDISQAYWSRIERGLELAPEFFDRGCMRLGLPTDRAFIEARRLPPRHAGRSGGRSIGLSRVQVP